MVAKEYIYILSRDFQLIRQYIDYSSLTGKYEMLGIHTENYLAIDNIKLNDASILIVDSITMGQQVIKIVDDFILHSDVSNKCIIYLVDEIDLELKLKLKSFYKYFFMLKTYDVLDLLYVIDTIHKSRSNNDVVIEDAISKSLQSLGVATHLLGFIYLTKACLIRYQYRDSKVSYLFDKIAREYHTTSARVDRCVRNAIQYAYEHNPKRISSFCQFSKKPSNSRFISCVVLEIEHKL